MSPVISMDSRWGFERTRSAASEVATTVLPSAASKLRASNSGGNEMTPTADSPRDATAVVASRIRISRYIVTRPSRVSSAERTMESIIQFI